MAYKFQLGAARLSGSIVVEDSFEADASVVDSLNVQSGGITNAGAIAGATSIDGSGDLTMGTITMTGFAVDADGDLSAKSLKVDDDSYIGTDSDSDMLLLDPDADITVASDLDFIIAKAGGLQLADGAVLSTAAELNLLDGAAADTIVNSKAVIYGSSGEVNATSYDLGGNNIISSAGNFQGNNASFAELSASAGISGSSSLIIAGEVQLNGVAETVMDVNLDFFYFQDADGKMKKEGAGDYANAIAGNGLAASSGVLAVGAASNGGINVAANDLGLDLNDLAAATVAVGADSIAIIDADDNSTKKESIADLVAGMQSTGLDAASGQLSVSVAQTGITSMLNSSMGKLGTAADQENIDFGTANSIIMNIDNAAALTVNGSGVTVAGDLTVNGTTTTVNSTTINITSSLTFEGLADDYETTLNIVDPTADRTISLANAGGFLQPFAAASTDQITATPAELNILDGALVETAELNLLDGGASSSSITLVDGDGFIVNDGGTMKLIPASDIKSYVSDAAADVAVKADGDTLAVGVNYFADMGSDGEDAVTLPASPSVGQSVKVKAPSDCGAARYITINPRWFSNN